jgi:chromosome segregation ATPase
LHNEVDETLSELRVSEENSKKAMSDAARLAEELRQEQEHSSNLERQRKSLENQLKDMQNRLDEAEAAALKGGKKVIAKLEIRIRELETEIDNETRRHSEAQKNIAKQERRIRELAFQIDEDKKNQERLTDLIDKLQQKVKLGKRQVEEAEEMATVNLQKYRQLQAQLEDAEERADVAENSLAKIRARGRGGAPLTASRSGGNGMMRSSSVQRAVRSAADVHGAME